MAAGALLGLALGLAVSVVLVHVVNPQSFHWTMDLRCPGRAWSRCAPRWWRPAPSPRRSARAAAAARCGAGGEGGLVMRRRLLAALRGRRAAGPRARAVATTTRARGARAAFPARPRRAPGARTEWWYITGWLRRRRAAPIGFQVTFFRRRTGLATRCTAASRRASCCSRTRRCTDVRGRPPSAGPAHRARTGVAARPTRTRPRATPTCAMGHWSLRREAPATRRPVMSHGSAAPTPRFACSWTAAPRSRCCCRATPGFSRKGPQKKQASHYYSQPQLRCRPCCSATARRTACSGRAWLDHEWSDESCSPTPWAGTGSA